MPRNSSGVPTDDAGGLGTSSYQFSEVYGQQYYVGDSSSNNTIEEDGSNNVIIKRNGLTVGTFESGGLTRESLEAIGQQLSSSCSNYSTSSGTFVDVTNLSITITTTGRPVILMLVGDETAGNVSGFRIESTSTSGALLQLKFVRDTTDLGRYSAAGIRAALGASSQIYSYTNCLMHFDPISSGTYTYKVQAVVTGTGGTGYVSYYKLLAYEL